jgi:hypothetical protein
VARHLSGKADRHKKVVERAGMAGHGIGKGIAAGNVFGYGRNCFFKNWFFGDGKLLERFDKRNTGLDHGGELAGEKDHILERYFVGGPGKPLF